MLKKNNRISIATKMVDNDRCYITDRKIQRIY